MDFASLIPLRNQSPNLVMQKNISKPFFSMHQGEVGINIGQAVYLLHIVVTPPLSVKYFPCEGERKAVLLFACILQQAADALSTSLGVLYIKNKLMAMIYTTFTLPSFIFSISLGIGIAYSWWTLSAATVGWEQDPVMPWQVQRGRKGQELQHYTIILFIYA